MATPSNRRRRFRREGSEDRPPLRLQDRDRDMIKLAHDYRLLTSRHFQLLIQGSGQKLLRRFQKLFKHHYLDRIQRLGNLPMVYALASRGADELTEMGLIERGKINWSDKNRHLAEHFMAHTLMVSDIRCLMTVALRTIPDITLQSWVNEGELRHDVLIEGPQKRKMVAHIIPDGSFVLEKPRPGGGKPLQRHCFLEADRGTEAGSSKFREKVQAYWTFWQEGDYEKTYQRKGFDVLVVCRGEKRRDNLRRITQGVADRPEDQGLERFHFAAEPSYTLDDPSTILKPIWLSGRKDDDTLHHLLE